MKNPCILADTGTNQSCYHSVSHTPCGICLIRLRTRSGRLFISGGLKSLSDVTVAPVVPTAISAHRSQNELHRGMADALHRPAPLFKLFSRLLFLLKRIFRVGRRLRKIASASPIAEMCLLYIGRYGIANSIFTYYNKIIL